MESALLPPRPSSIHIGLAEVDLVLSRSGCALPIESGFAQFREREGGGVGLGKRVEATATDEQEDGMECRDLRPSPTTFSLPTSRIILSTYMTIISPTHTRIDDVSPPHPYILHTRSLFKKDWEMDILKRALQGREHDFSGRSPGPYDGPPSEETTEDLSSDGDENSSGNGEDVEDDDSGKRMPTNCINKS